MVEGYKVFNEDWTCRGFQYEVGKTFEENMIPSCCERGFHFCKELKDCFNYYPFNPDNKVAKVIALYKTTGGFLKDIKMESRQAWWNALMKEDKDSVLLIPNFDAEIFKEITGIDVNLGRKENN